MKNNQYVMYLWQETEMRRKEKEERKKMMQNQKSNLENDEKKEKNQHDSIEKKILNKEKKNVINELKVTKLGATVYDFLINTKQNDVVQSPSQAKQQKNVEEDVGTSDQQYDAPQEKRLKYLGQETEMRRKEKEEHKKMMENQKSNLENDEKKEKNQHDSIEKKILNKEKKNVINELEVTKLGATVYDFLINTKQNDVVQSPSQAKQQKNVEEDVGTFDQQYDAPQEKQLKYLGQETEMRRKEKEEHKKMMEKQKSNLENDEKKEKNQHDSIEKKILNKEKKNVINELKVTKLGATVYDFLIVLKYLGQEIEMRRKEKEEYKKMMEIQKSNLENDEKKEKNQHDSIEKKILNIEKKNVTNELEVTKLGATVYDFLINTKQNDVVQSPSQAKQQKNVEEDVGTSDQQYDAPQEK